MLRKTKSKEISPKKRGLLEIFLLLLVPSIGALEGGWPGALLGLGIFFFTFIGSLVGVIPFGGPILYWFLVGWSSGSLAGVVDPPLFWTNVIPFYIHFGLSIIYCFFSTSTLIFLWRMRGKMDELKEKLGEKLVEALKEAQKNG